MLTCDSAIKEKCQSRIMFLVSFWRGRLVETIDKWEAEYEIEIRIKLTGRELEHVMINC